MRGAGTFGQTIRTTRWRFIQWSDGAAELYDHDADPQEMNDVSGLSAHAPLIRELKARLQKTVPFTPPPAEAGSPPSAKKKKKSA